MREDKSFEPKNRQSKSDLYSGGKGMSIEEAVLINTTSSNIGVSAEYQYVSQLHGERGKDWNLEYQDLLNLEGKHYDALHIKTRDGCKLTYYFDISKFFGKEWENLEIKEAYLEWMKLADIAKLLGRDDFKTQK